MTTGTETGQPEKRPTKDASQPEAAGSDRVQPGYKNCRTTVKKFFKDYLFVGGNLPGEKQRGLDPLLTHLIKAIDMLDLESDNGQSLEVWTEIRDELHESLSGYPQSAEQAALADVTIKHEIPETFLFDVLDGADHWIRNRKFETYDELLEFAAQTGGATMAACVPVLGFEKPGYETAAVRCGQAIMLTQLLANCATSAKQNRNLLPVADLDECEVVLHRMKLRQGGDSIKHLVRLMCFRIEKLFYEAGKLVPHMDFDGARTVKSLLGIHWLMLVKMRREPELALAEEGVLSRGDMFKLKTKHLLGLEGNIPVIPEDHGHH